MIWNNSNRGSRTDQTMQPRKYSVTARGRVLRTVRSRIQGMSRIGNGVVFTQYWDFLRSGREMISLTLKWPRGSIHWPLFEKLHNPVKHMNLLAVGLEKLQNLCTILHKLCIFSYTTVGRFICFTVLCIFKPWSNSVWPCNGFPIFSYNRIKFLTGHM